MIRTAFFGRYRVGKEDVSTWDVGAEIELDPYDGFFDQALDSCDEGEELAFLVDEGQFGPVDATDESWRSARRELAAATFIVGEYRPVGYRLRITGRHRFDDAIELLPGLAHWDEIGMLRDVHRTMPSGPGYRYKIDVRLPTISQIRQAERDGFAGASMARITNGRIDTIATSPYLERIFVERVDAGYRVIALGSNDIGSCRVHLVADVDAYEAGLRAALRTARLHSRREARLWKHLLS